MAAILIQTIKSHIVKQRLILWTNSLVAISPLTPRGAKILAEWQKQPYLTGSPMLSTMTNRKRLLHH